ncbi:DUF748 domain-containing protein [Paraburkholderia domus]|uniref:AsmA family protein n=1 Tax=Paraburkholderia domus TaxID=2793075 RepID=A0A9N8QZ74_9BURK|nr:DUF748 domain-containing protein [Paraburkholderia domus]MBK5166247.1 DUF748 domain-containing protein [Burkholderia sp. R-70211]MBK5179479.1 DUF748 domain-containing protein [Burkholderia sp. R-69749]MCI0146418.1 DUF748 domain-containing protein [Paraburkholderia sediminicola]CAE6787173.1 hypothetical protein R69749_01967 [Paraburkholderia domus]CAE6906203.1 hypothetical protein R70211_03609 [Paraburkholderia domus]
MASLNKVSLASSIQTVRDVAQSRRTRRVITGLLIFLVLFGLLGFFAAPPLIRHIAEQQLSKQLDRPATIGRIALNPYTLKLEADRVHIGERGGAGDFVDISRLIVKPSWSSLFRAAPIIDEVQLDSPRFHIVRYDAQRFNFTDLIEKFSKQPAKPDSKPTLFSVSNIRLENGQITFDDKLLGATHVIDQWKLGIPFIATLPSKTDIFVEPLLRARIDGSPLAIDGKTKPFAASRESEVSLRFDGLDVPQLLSYAPTKLPVIVQSGKLSTDLKLNFVMSNDTPSLRVAGTVDLNDVDVRDQSKAPFFAARAVHVAAATLEPLKSLYHIDDIRIDAPSANLARDKEGVLSVERMFAPAPAKAASAPAAATTAENAASAPVAASGTSATDKTAQPLDLSIKRFSLNDGSVNVHDEAASRPVDAGLQKLAVTLTDFSTLAAAPAHYTLNTDFKDAGGSLGVAGTFGLVAKTANAKLDLKSLKLPLLQPYIDTATAAQVVDGALSATANLDANWSKSPTAVMVTDTQLDLQSLKLAVRGSKTPVVSLTQGQVTVKQVDLAGRTANITGVDTTGLVVNAQRLKDGSIDLAALAGPHQAEQRRTAIHAVKKAQAEGPAWHYKIGELNLKDATANFTDNTTPQPVKLSVTPLQLKVQQISDDLSKPLPVDLQATLNKKGTLGIKGDVTATPLKVAVKVNANRLDAAAFEPYFGSKLNALIASALLNANGDLALSQAKALKATYRGDVALVEVRMIDKATSDPFAGWGSLALTNLKADYDEHGTVVDAGRVTFTKFYGRVLLDAQGKLNLKDVVAHESGAAQSLTRDKSGSEPVPLTPQAASAPSAPVVASAPVPASSATPATVTAATPPQSPVKLHFGQLVLQQGRVNYTDNFIKPNFTANLVGIQGTVGAFGTQSTTPAPVDIAAKVAANGPLSIRGTVNPLIAKPALDLTASAHDIELTNLTPYSAKYAGYPITKGKLNVDLHYKLDNDQLNANNHIFIDQLTFGDHVENNTATKLPVRLAISLLKNSRGEIDVNLPVSGSLSNPEFSIGGLIWHAVLNLLEKAVTAPFSLIANAFGGNGEELGYVEFDPGSAKLSDAADKKLDTIVKALADKSSIRIDLIGRVDPAIDEPGLRAQYVERQVKQQKIKDVVGNGESVDLSTVTVDPKEYDKYLTKAYKAGDFKKPRNFVGLTKSLPDDEMKAAMAANAPIDDASLRQLAQQRAQAVQQYFEGKIDSSRVFIVAPKLNADGIKDKGATTRVDFGLK